MYHRGHSISTRRATVLVALLILLLASTQLAFAAADEDPRRGESPVYETADGS